MASNRTELAALKRLLSEADLILSTTTLPENRTARCREMLHSALAITGHRAALAPQNSGCGQLGLLDEVIAKRGSAYFRKLAARRKTHGGGRPRKEGQ